MSNFLNKILIIVIAFTTFLNANPFINGKIVDIGVGSGTAETTAPMVWKSYAATYSLVEDMIRSKKRTLSAKKECFTDSLGSTVCPIENKKCTISNDTMQGTSTLIESSVFDVKKCPQGTLKIGDKCYLDADANRVADIKDKVKIQVDSYFDGDPKNPFFVRHNYNGRYVRHGCSIPGEEKMLYGEWSHCVPDVLRGGYEWRPKGTFPPNHACVDQETNLKVTQSNADISLKFAGSFNGVIGNNCELGWRDIYTAQVPEDYIYTESDLRYETYGSGCYHSTYQNVNLIKDVNVEHTECREGGAQLEYVKVTGTITAAQKCPEGYKVDSYSTYNKCYIEAFCQEPFTENIQGKCEQKYNYYKYSCPVEKNYYEYNYHATDEGLDCRGHCPSGRRGGCYCNPSLPKEDNCKRTTFNCLYDQSKVCTKMEGDSDICPPDYKKVNGRCQRIKKYCGDYVYDVEKDSCVESETYEKKCTSQGDVYDSTKNICVSAQEVCENGTYNSLLGKCTTDPTIECLAKGYTYNETTEQCENPNLPICEEGYKYSSSQNLCLPDKNICEAGFTYNKAKSKCEIDKCLTSHDNSNTGRCEYDASAICDGTLTKDGQCIPNKIYK